jgi:hypothetical protein
MANPEHHSGNMEHGAEIARAAAERSAELHEREAQKGERPDELGEKLVNEARAEAEKQARSTEEYRPATEAEPIAPSSMSDVTPDQAYEQTMETIQQEMSAPARTFSKIIHNKAVEKTSDVVGSTIARPDAILSGSLFAFILVLALYVEAKYVGHSLSGFETIGAFIVGWILGIAFDFLRKMITGKR